ncbi:MAG: glutaredoxin [Bdellovibrionales bacterium]|nr:glutaredoxin [Bdellovibrionales bacterium]
MKAIRYVLGKFIVLLDWVFTPSSVQRDSQVQKQIEEELKSMALYQFETCPFCVKVRRQAKRLGLSLEYRDAKDNPQHREDLLQGGGKIKVPCLRYEDPNGHMQWMYESSVINQYLLSRFPPDLKSS